MSELIRLPKTDLPIFDTVSKFARLRNVKVYLVGGYLRDMLLKRQKPEPDIDFAVPKTSIGFARALCLKMRCGFVVLDKERGVARLVKKLKNTACTLDFTDFRGPALGDDLRLRDFTLNAMAVELACIKNGCFRRGDIIDPYGGMRDLKQGLLRLPDKSSFEEDPLRILRAFSLKSLFGFAFDKELYKYMKAAKRKLASVSSERVRDELFKVLDAGSSAQRLLEMDTLGLLGVILPEIEVMRGVRQGPYHHLDVWKHSLETVRQADLVIEEHSKNETVRQYLDEIMSAGRKRKALLKLAALLHDIGKPASKKREKGRTRFHGHERAGMFIAKAIAERLKLSNEEIYSLRKMVFWHLRPGYLADNEKITLRAKFRYFRDTGKEGVSVLLLSIADQRSTRGILTSDAERRHHEKVVSSLIKEYLKKQKEKPERRLINGDDLIRRFKLASSPLIGNILKEIEELQAIGKIRTKPEALKAASRIIKESSK